MPLVRISLRRGKSPAYLAAIRDGIYAAMHETFDVPEDDRFMLVTQHDAEEFDYAPRYLGIARSDDLVVIQITANNTRTVEQKQALYVVLPNAWRTIPACALRTCSSALSVFCRRTGRLETAEPNT